jgi:arginyl-tRNA synthetase
MSTLEYYGMVTLLKQLSISTDSSMIESTKLLANPLDVLRASLTELLVKIVDCQAEDANKSIQWPNDLSNGDLSVTLPRLRPGCKPKDLSSEVVNKVCSFLLCTTP